MKKIKQAFTIVELLICLTIIGIIMTVAIQAFKTVADSYPSLTYFAFKNVKLIVKSMYEINTQAPLPFNYMDGEEEKSKRLTERDVYIQRCLLNQADENGRPILWSVGVLKPDVKDNISCTRNEAGVGSCMFGDDHPVATINDAIPFCAMVDGTISAGNQLEEGDPFVEFPDKEGDPFVNYAETPDEHFNFAQIAASMLNTTGEVNTNSYEVGINENNYEYLTPYISNLDENSEPTFTLTNGQNYYITRRYFNPNISQNFGFRLIAVDLNGKRGPNIISPSKNGAEVDKMNSDIPDIVTFMVMDNGFVYPLGVAANNKMFKNGKGIIYLNSRVRAYDYDVAGSVEDATCLVGVDDKDRGQKGQCAFTVTYKSAKNFYGADVEVGDYRTRFCASGQEGSQTKFYREYCNGINIIRGCPGSGQPYDTQQTEQDLYYDECYSDPIKPAFRYNM